MKTPDAATEDEKYVISDERLAEIRALLVDDGYYVLAKADASRQELAAAIYDLLGERDDRCAGPTITGSSHRADDPGQVWVRMSEADYEALRG